MDPLQHDDPERIGGFRLIARLGSGGMGTVYLARSERGRTVALKTVHADFAGRPEFRTRFHLEADAARVIGGRFGATVVDADPLAEMPWLATEYVLGPALDDAVEQYGPLPAAAVRGLGALLCDALTQLHDSGIVHRDLKPSNVLLTAAGPKLIDFGIARAVGDERLTSTGAVAGTPAYMSPEQASGGEHLAASDVFALAGVLLFAATGRAPFGQGQPADLLYRVRHEDPDLSGVPVGLGPVLHRCFAKDATERPSATQLVGYLRVDQVEFADVLPADVLGDIALRGTRIWQLRPERLPTPAHLRSTVNGAESKRALSRRAALGLAGGTAVAVGAVVWGGRAFLGEDGDQRTGGSTGKPTPSDGPPRMAWRYDGNLLAGELLRGVGELLLVMDREGMVALDAKGERKWINPEIFHVQPLTEGTRLFAITQAKTGTRGKMVRSISLETGALGKVLTTVPEELSMGSVDQAHHERNKLVLLVLTIGSGARLLCVDTDTGDTSWDVAIKTKDSFDLLATASSEKFVVLCTSTVVYAVEMDSGDISWRRKLPEPKTSSTDRRPGPPVIAGDHVVLGSGELVALRLSDGEVAWRFGEDRKFDEADESHPLYGPPTARDGVVYVCERSAAGLLAVDLESGKLEWEEPESAAKSELTVRPVATKDHVYTAASSGALWIHAVNRRDGSTVWDFQGPQASGVIALSEHNDQLVMQRGNTLCAVPIR